MLSGAAVIGGLAVAGLLIWKYWEPLSSMFNSVFSGLSSGLTECIPLIGIFKSALNGLGGLAQSIANSFGAMSSAISGAADGLRNVIGLQSQVSSNPINAANPVGTFQTATHDIVKNSLSIIKPFLPAGLGAAIVPHFAEGNELGKSLAKENQLAPSGAKAQLAVINSSEGVLNQDQQRQIGKTITNNTAPIFHLHGTPVEMMKMLEENIGKILNTAMYNAELENH